MSLREQRIEFGADRGAQDRGGRGDLAEKTFSIERAVQGVGWHIARILLLGQEERIKRGTFIGGEEEKSLMRLK